MKGMAWVTFCLILVGVVFYGWARAVLLVLLGAGAIFLLICIVLAFEGTAQGIKKRRLELEGAARHDVERLAQAAALLGAERGQPAAADVPATDAELRELRRLAGLDKKSGTAD